jgi:hypothetical protein
MIYGTGPKREKRAAQRRAIGAEASAASTSAGVRERRYRGPAAAGRLDSTSRERQAQAWQWAQANRRVDGSLPSGREIARQHGRNERWGRLVKRAGCAGEFVHGSESGLRLVGQVAASATTNDSGRYKE